MTSSQQSTKCIKRSILFSIVTYLCFFTSITSTTVFAEANEQEVRGEMSEMHLIVQDLFPLIVKTGSLNRKEKERLQTSVESLLKHVNALEKSEAPRTDPFQISMDMLKSHLEYTRDAASNNEYTYARSLIKELPQLCSTCHTQDEQVKHFDSSHIKDKLKSDYERGQYHFMTRDYQEALLDYNDHLAKQRKIKHGHHNSEAMEKILLIYLNVYKSPQLALVYFNRLLETDNLSLDMAIDVNHWLHGLDAIKLKAQTVKDINAVEIEVRNILKFEDDTKLPVYISEKNKVGAIWLRGLIYDFINRNPKHRDMPKLLYWLASMESALEYGIYYQLPETYLKACVTNYSKHPYAKRCLEQYEAQVIFNYTGSGGTHLPDYKKAEIDFLKNKLAQ